MKHSESIKMLSAALKDFAVVNVPKNANNPFFKSKYATLDSIIEHSKDMLRSLGITVIQGAAYNPEGLTIETRLIHESGEWIETETFVPIEKQTPQGAGSAITYGRRYALGAILNIGTDEDDDGNGANKTTSSEVKINFDQIDKDLSAMKTEEEINGYMIKIKGRPDRKDWTAEQVKDVKNILDAQIARVKIENELGERQ